MKPFGQFSLQLVEFGTFRLDGGAMFGSVPKNLWSRSVPADAENCIRLVCRSLIVRHAARVFLVDVGMGEKWTDKQRSIFGIENSSEESWGFRREEVTDVILTHLHFDHAGGVTRYSDAGTLELSYPRAKIHLQIGNWNHARNPSLKDRASYLPENVAPLESADLVLCDGAVELYPGVRVHRVDGHTPGQQWVEIDGGDEVIFFPTDLVPTAHHVPVPYHMGYDLCAETILREKTDFLDQAVARNAIVVFEHDPDTPAARIRRNDKGGYELGERVTL